MREAEEVCAFARKHKNAMAYCKGTELRAKLSGLLIERVETVTVDLRGSLDQARERVLKVIEHAQRTAIPASIPATGKDASLFGYNGPGRPGNPLLD